MINEGILPVLKPKGWTSHDVVAKTRRILKIKRIGHTGTLDPEVTGVLPLCIGKATRVVEYIQLLPKEYEVILKLGISTDTEDMTGTVIEQMEQVKVTKEQLQQTISSFVGEIEQIPPMYSAVKINGKKLYELARKGEEVERKARSVTIHKIDLLQFDLDQKFPEVKFKVLCSKGTYIRTLCVDIGKELNIPATMLSLVRTATGNIQLEDCLTIEEIEKLVEEDELNHKLITIDQSIQHFPSFVLHNQQLQNARFGKKLRFSDLNSVPESKPELIRLYSENLEFIGIYKLDHSNQLVIPNKLFLNN
ncbi:tRNA pseudouridine(55) synthase TruB [Chengkuizengella axinellae]|uniref:tRNA pseudouridine synthase B n=1 Tax=Chengkuizengella axinellae TaxID=3064388 RepID=A0ABT9IVV4_9BACL|nr:tRNA pseudouridine(55) synthase TruB [Chengkuizengella sp. 2205SS18-9]MDP5273486.1 tRNA pseudouridine(55) synthase TruB [Chengkuizengella sp. 2205SS18-9]